MCGGGDYRGESEEKNKNKLNRRRYLAWTDGVLWMGEEDEFKSCISEVLPPPTLQPLSETRKKRERTESLTHEMFCHVEYWAPCFIKNANSIWSGAVMTMNPHRNEIGCFSASPGRYLDTHPWTLKLRNRRQTGLADSKNHFLNSNALRTSITVHRDASFTFATSRNAAFKFPKL